MSQLKDIVALVGLSLGTVLAGTGCLAQNADDTTEPEIAAAADQDSSAVADTADESTGEANQACFGFGGFGGCGLGFGGCGLGFGGCGLGFGGCGLGFGGLGFGGCGLGFGGFGGCGLGCW